MRALLSFENFDAFGGTETYTLTVAHELERLGHEAPIYSPNPGAMADLAQSQGARVLGPGELPADCDVVLAQDAATCFELAGRYPDVPRVLVSHSRDHALQYVPQLPGACDAVVALNDRVRMWIEAQPQHPPLTRLRQPIDLPRFQNLGFARSRPRRVLASSNYVSGARAALIDQACRDAGLEVDWIGTTTHSTGTPEQALSEADIVIGLGRTVLEAMAAGRAVYVYGMLGSGGWVTPESYPQLEADGFAGHTGDVAMDAPRLAAELALWHPDMPEANRDLASRHRSADHAVALVDLIRGLDGSVDRRSAPSGDSAPMDELARLVRLEWQATARTMRAVVESNRLRAERELYAAEAESSNARVSELDEHLRDAQARLAELDGRLAAAETYANETDEQLQALLATRRYQLAVSALAPFDRLRARRR
jgi:hypothetical protein